MAFPTTLQAPARKAAPSPLQRVVLRVVLALKAELVALHFKMRICNVVVSFVPTNSFPWLRAHIYRLFGFTKIHSSVYISDALGITGSANLYNKLAIGAGSAVSVSCSFDLAAPIVIGERVGIGNHVVFVTSTHDVGPAWRRWGEFRAESIVVEDGAWIGARATILPGVVIGAGAVVSAGAVVTRSIPPNVMAAGNPARVVSQLEGRVVGGRAAC